MVRSPEGYLLLPAEDDRLIAHLIDSGGRLEPGTITVIQALIKPGDTVIDVGAHLGLTVLPAARAAGPGGRVIAVEPGSRVAGLLRRNIALNALDEVVVVHGCAAGASPGKARLSIRPVLGESSLINPITEGPTEEVLVQPLDALVPPGTRIRLAKIDVEGYELEVWRGMTRIVADNPDLALLLEFGPSHLQRAGITPAEWMSSFVQAGFRIYEVEEMKGLVRPARPLDALQQMLSVNLLMLRAPLSEYPALRTA
nr:FkbM family methyltransferase [Plastoroseomonas hellenica]